MGDLRSGIPDLQQLGEVARVVLANHLMSLCPRLLTALPITCGRTSRWRDNAERILHWPCAQTNRFLGNVGSGELHLRVRRRMVTLELVRLLKPDRITAVDCTAGHDGGINTDIDLVVLRRGA